MENKETGLTLLKENKPTLTQLVLVNMPHGSTLEQAERMAIKEINNLELIFSLKPDLLACNPNSVLLAVKQCIGDNLTLAPSAGLVYLFPGKVKVGQQNNTDIYETVLMYDPTANGRLSIARQSGRILDNKRPTFIYDEKGAVNTVTVEFLVPSYPEPRWEVITFDTFYFERWKQKSAAKFGGKPNPNYTSFNGGINPEFAGSKAIRHGLNKLGINMNERKDYSVANDYKPLPTSAVIKEVKDHIEDVPHTIVEEKDINPQDLY